MSQKSPITSPRAHCWDLHQLHNLEFPVLFFFFPVFSSHLASSFRESSLFSYRTALLSRSYLILTSEAVKSHTPPFCSLLYSSSLIAWTPPQSWKNTCVWPCDLLPATHVPVHPSFLRQASQLWCPLSVSKSFLPQQSSFLPFSPSVWPLKGVQAFFYFWTWWPLLSVTLLILFVTWMLDTMARVLSVLAPIIYTWPHQVFITWSQWHKHFGWPLPSPTPFLQAPF